MDRDRSLLKMDGPIEQRHVKTHPLRATQPSDVPAKLPQIFVLLHRECLFTHYEHLFFKSKQHDPEGHHERRRQCQPSHDA